MDAKELKEFLDYKADYFENPSFIQDDPLQFPHRFNQKEDIEIIGFLMATIAWGNRKSIISSGEKLLQIMSNEPFAFIQEYKTPKSLIPFSHRTFNSEDLHFFFLQLQNIYQKSNLEECFSEGENAFERITNFRHFFLANSLQNRSQKHISNPAKNSAAKRLNMYLRWMCRSNSKKVDLGIWKSIPTQDLMLPLDVHTSTISRKLGLLQRKQDDWKALEELMQNLKSFDPIDPVKYDFALFGLGAIEKF